MHPHDHISEAEPRMITHTAMTAALDHGAARPLSWLVPDYVRYDDAWWLLTPPGWLRIDDPELLILLHQPHPWTEDPGIVSRADAPS